LIEEISNDWEEGRNQGHPARIGCIVVRHHIFGLFRLTEGIAMRITKEEWFWGAVALVFASSTTAVSMGIAQLITAWGF